MHHWIHDDANYYAAFIDMIMEANHNDAKVIIGKERIECKRGQSINSLETWARVFGKKWTIQKVRTFFKMLEDDSMITREGLRKTTRVTICNYDTYQERQQADNNEITTRQQADNNEITTNKKDKKEKNEKNDKEISDALIKNHPFFKDTDFESLWDGWIEVRTKIRAPNTVKALTIAINKLDSMGIDIAKTSLSQSIERGWRGVFEPKLEFSCKTISNIQAKNIENLKRTAERFENEQANVS